jgi:undecaprenyl-diphosphatase
LLDDVNSHESFAAGSLGFPSGHAAVSAALTAVAFAFLPRRVALIALGVAVVVMLGRMYVGAHLPLDLVGGAALGAIAGSLANLLVGVPAASGSESGPD